MLLPGLLKLYQASASPPSRLSVFHLTWIEQTRGRPCMAKACGGLAALPCGERLPFRRLGAGPANALHTAAQPLPLNWLGARKHLRRLLGGLSQRLLSLRWKIIRGIHCLWGFNFSI